MTAMATQNASQQILISLKLMRSLKLTDEFETYKNRFKFLEDEQKSMQESFESSQTKIKECKVYKIASLTNRRPVKLHFNASNVNSLNCNAIIKKKIIIKLECHSRRGNLKFYRIKEREHESNKDPEDLLRNFYEPT